LEALADRLCFVTAPFDLSIIAEAADEFQAGLLCLDYIQRISPPGKHADKRGAVDATMSYLRNFADAGIALIVVAAVARSKDKKGRSTYDGSTMNLASFRESSELEFGADDAFILAGESDSGLIEIKHLKSRHGETRDLLLHFERQIQRFGEVPCPGVGKRRSNVAALWQKTEPANDDDDEGDDE
jgi:replicative DNA helicase